MHLFYDGFVNRLGNKKYKRRLDIINNELAGIKDGEFAVKSGSNGAKYEAEKGASKSEAPKEEEAEKKISNYREMAAESHGLKQIEILKQEIVGENFVFVISPNSSKNPPPLLTKSVMK